MTDDTPARLRILARAAEVTGGERQDSYGPVEQNLQRIADLWTAYLDCGVTLRPESVAWMVVLLKAARAEAERRQTAITRTTILMPAPMLPSQN